MPAMTDYQRELMRRADQMIAERGLGQPRAPQQFRSPPQPTGPRPGPSGTIQYPINPYTLHDERWGGIGFPGTEPTLPIPQVPTSPPTSLRRYARPESGIMGRSATGAPVAYGREAGMAPAYTEPELETRYHAGLAEPYQTPAYDLGKHMSRFAFQPVSQEEIPPAVAQAMVQPEAPVQAGGAPPPGAMGAAAAPGLWSQILQWLTGAGEAAPEKEKSAAFKLGQICSSLFDR